MPKKVKNIDMTGQRQVETTCSRGHTFHKSTDLPVCPTCWPGYYKKQSNLPPGLPAPAVRALLGADITRLEQLAKHSEAELSTLHGMGPKAIDILKSAMQEKDIEFKS